MASWFMAHLAGLVTGLTMLLFIAVACMVAYGAVHFRRSTPEVSPGSGTFERRVDMRREVLWTGVAATLLLLVFAYVH